MKLMLGDCVDVLRSVESNSVDMVFADPPFNVGVKYSKYKDLNPNYQGWCGEWIAECFRVLKPTGSFYLMTITRHLEWKMPIMAKHGVFVNLISWRNTSSSTSVRSFGQEYQPIMLYGKTENYTFHKYAVTKPPKFVRWGKHKSPPKNQMTDRWEDIKKVYAGSIAHPEAILEPGTKSKAHVAQMPIGLAQRAILFSTNVGDLVLDPFMGSGTTGVACVKTGRDFIGIETDEKYFAIAETRIADMEFAL